MVVFQIFICNKKKTNKILKIKHITKNPNSSGFLTRRIHLYFPTFKKQDLFCRKIVLHVVVFNSHLISRDCLLPYQPLYPFSSIGIKCILYKGDFT